MGPYHYEQLIPLSNDLVMYSDQRMTENVVRQF